MAVSTRDLKEMSEKRYSEDTIVADYLGRVTEQKMSTWHGDMAESDKADQGKYVFEKPDGTTEEVLNVENTYRDNSRDLSRQVGETVASLQIDPVGNGDEDEKKAALRQTIGNMYWELDRGDRRFIPRLVRDWYTTGAMFLYSFDDPGKSDYPVHQRLDPRNCYPTFFEDELIDLVYSVRKQIRAVAAANPDHGIPYDPKSPDEGDLIYFFDGYKLMRVFYTKSPEQTYLIDSRDNPIGRVPISAAVEFGPDGRIEVPFLHMKNVLNSENQVFSLWLNGVTRGVYHGWFIRGEVDTSEFGYGGEARGADEKSDMKAVEPPRMDPSTLPILAQLNQYARGTGAYPSQRQGGQLPSIISAAGVQALQGQRETLVAYVQRQLAYVREQQTEIDYLLDSKTDLNKSKPLRLPSGKTVMYTPAETLLDDGKLRAHPRVTFAGSGLSAANNAVMALQKAGSGVLAYESARRLDPDIQDPLDEERKIEQEQLRKVILQTTLPSLDPITQLRFFEMVSKGMSGPEAVAKLLEAPEQIGVGQPPGQPPGPEVGPVSAPEEAAALMKGAQPGAELPPVGPLPAFTNIVLRPPGG